MPPDSNRREFLAASAAFTIIPRPVLGGPGFVAPSDKIHVAYIGTGTQGLRELMPMLTWPDVRVVAVCDPSKDAAGYKDWSPTGLLEQIRGTLKKPDWRAGAGGAVPGGRDAAQNIVDTYYGSKGCASYADYRELLDKEKDVNAVKIMTPDHLHGVIATAAMKRGKHVVIHKPLANRLREARQVIDAARASGVATHFIPWDANGSMDQVMAWINDGSIGTLRAVHNWTNRPVWPQYAALPADSPPCPAGFDWDLWLGPEAERAYHPCYTHMVFRGWYDFGGGSMADMGHYSLWTVFNALKLSAPVSVEPMFSHQCAFRDTASTTLHNDYSFPVAGAVRFRYPQVDLWWHEGGMRPPTPDELGEEELPREGMLFVGDKGKILAGFHVDNPRLLGRPYQAPPPRPAPDWNAPSDGMRQWMAACRGAKQQSPGNFLNAWPISEAANLYAAAYRAARRLRYDAASMSITNAAEANKYLTRDYRKGWELQA